MAPSLSPLTPPQARFAARVGATDHVERWSADGTVFLYRESELRSDRWLVDAAGRVLDVEHFHKLDRRPLEPRRVDH